MISEREKWNIREMIGKGWLKLKTKQERENMMLDRRRWLFNIKIRRKGGEQKTWKDKRTQNKAKEGNSDENRSDEGMKQKWSNLIIKKVLLSLIFVDDREYSFYDIIFFWYSLSTLHFILQLNKNSWLSSCYVTINWNESK